jgi:predicted nucleic acid-binding protein
MVTAFDADVLIYAAAPGHPLGRRVAPLFDVHPEVEDVVGIGSVLLLTEVLAKPLRTATDSDESLTLISLLGRLNLLPFDAATAQLSLALAVRYDLRAADAAHLATAVAAGADRFLTNNRKDFPQSIAEIDVVYPDQLAVPD